MGGLAGHLVGWRQAEYSSCASATRSRFHLPPLAWWHGAEVPIGCMAELPWVHAYSAQVLHAGGRTFWSIFRSDRALRETISLLDAFHNLRVLRRFPPRLIGWIRSLGVANICSGTEGPDGDTTATLVAFLDHSDHLLDTEALRQRLLAHSGDRPHSEGWFWKDLEAGDGRTRVLVAGDLRDFSWSSRDHRQKPSPPPGYPCSRASRGRCRSSCTAAEPPTGIATPCG